VFDHPKDSSLLPPFVLQAGILLSFFVCELKVLKPHRKCRVARAKWLVAVLRSPLRATLTITVT
jgi:hypothetical protein